MPYPIRIFALKVKTRKIKILLDKVAYLAILPSMQLKKGEMYE
jgi:hypothetical protein